MFIYSLKVKTLKLFASQGGFFILDIILILFPLVFSAGLINDKSRN